MLNVIHVITQYLRISEKRMMQFRKETESGSKLQIVVKYIKDGIPKDLFVAKI